jgi:hypothetical protein
MKLIKKIFNINNLILIPVVIFLIAAIHQFIEIFDNFDELIPHKGIIQDKKLSVKYFSSSGRRTSKKDSVNIFNFTVAGDNTTYTASRLPIKLDNLLQTGDSIEFYTKKITSEFGNSVTNGQGRVWNTHSANEVFHLVTNKYDSPIINFNDHRESVKSTIWILVFFSLLFFGWYIYRRSGKTSSLVLRN